jgi:hypothetical protein
MKAGDCEYHWVLQNKVSLETAYITGCYRTKCHWRLRISLGVTEQSATGDCEYHWVLQNKVSTRSSYCFSS